jgi:hypothetical protein
MRKAFHKFTNIDRIWCLAHRLHLIVTNALGFWIRVPVAGLNDGTDTSSESDVIGNEPDSIAVEELINEDDEGHTVDDDEFEMVSIVILYFSLSC